MFSLLHRIGRLLRGPVATGTARFDPDAMSLHDWADLPAHHPASDRAPC